MKMIYVDLPILYDVDGAPVNADSTPTAVWFKDGATALNPGVDTLACSVTNQGTGHYFASYDADDAFFVVGHSYRLLVTAVISAATKKWTGESITVDADVSSRASQTSVDGKPTLTQMEGSTVLALAAQLPRLKKNTAFSNYQVVLLRSDGTTPTDGTETITAQRSMDGAAYGNCANAVAFIGAGTWKITLAAGDVNADALTLKFTGTGVQTRWITHYPTP